MKSFSHTKKSSLEPINIGFILLVIKNFIIVAKISIGILSSVDYPGSALAAPSVGLGSAAVTERLTNNNSLGDINLSNNTLDQLPMSSVPFGNGVMSIN